MPSLLSRIFLSVSTLFLCAFLVHPLPARAEENTYSGIDLEYDEIVGDGSIADQGLIFANICTTAPGENDTCECRTSGKCSLEDVLQVFVNLSYFILGISGTVLLFVFVYGGFCWLIARGDSKLIERGRATMVGGVIGLVIIFGAYVIINFIIAGLKQGEAPTGSLEDTLEAPARGGDNSTGIDGAGDVINTN